MLRAVLVAKKRDVEAMRSHLTERRAAVVDLQLKVSATEELAAARRAQVTKTIEMRDHEEVSNHLVLMK